MKPFGVSPEQYNVLRILRGQNGNPITVSSIQDRMLNKMSNASRLVEKLKQKGFVNREECPADRRQVDIVITEKGLSLLTQLQEEILSQNRDLVQLDNEEVRGEVFGAFVVAETHLPTVAAEHIGGFHA